MNNLENVLYLADCRDLLHDWYTNGQTNFIDLIYIDPPFNSNRNYNIPFDSKLSEEAFTDTYIQKKIIDKGGEDNTKAAYIAWSTGVAVHALWNTASIVFNAQFAKLLMGA